MIGFKEFKGKIEKLEHAFSCSQIELNDLNRNENAEIDEVVNQVNSYCDNLSKSYLKNLKSYFVSITNLKKSIEELKLTSIKPSINSIKAYSYDNALQFLNENASKINELVNSLNAYKFQDSTLKYEFINEGAIIDGKEYTAPNFPKLTSNNFDTDRQYLEIISNLYNACLDHENCLQYLINYVQSSNFTSVISKEKKKILQEKTSEINNRYETQENAIYSKMKNDFESLLLNDLKEFNVKMSDYLSMDNFEMPNDFKRVINIGSISCNLDFYSRYESLIRKFDTEHLIKKNMAMPFMLDLEKNGNIIIENTSNKQDVIDFVHQLIMQFLTSAPYKKVNLSLVDIENSKFDFVFNYSKEYLKDNNLLFNGSIITEVDILKDAITSLNRKINVIKGDKLSLNNCKNVFEYNEISKENSQELNLFVLIYSKKYLEEEDKDKLLNIMKNGNQCGIYTMIIDNSSFDKVSNSDDYYDGGLRRVDIDYFIDECKQCANSFMYDEYSKSFIYGNGGSFVPNFGFTALDINEFFNKLDYGCDNLVNTNIINLDSIIDNKYERKPYYQQIKLPVGKDGGEPIYFELDVEGTGKSSCLIAGGTGSGKSSFLHTIILSGAYNYSPEELEFYLIDFKDGVEFNPYSDSVNGINIPHVSFLSLKNKVEDAYDILKMIYEEKTRRHNAFSKVNATDFASYHKHPDVKSGKYPSFKRTIVMIDEYQNFLSSTDTNTSILCNKCAGLLLSLLKEIRSAGISLVLASQSVSVEREALDQIQNRYIFSSSANVLQIAFPEFSGDELNSHLIKEKGLVYKTSNGGVSKKLFKAAYSGKTSGNEQKGIAKLINSKWSGCSNKKLTISGSDNNLSLYSSNVPFVNFTDVELTDDNIIKTYIGESALSGEPVSINFYDSDFCNYLILGELKKVRNIEASIGLSFLYSLKKYGFDMSKNNLYYLDLNNSNDAIRNLSPFDIYRDELEDVMTYSVEIDEITNSINNLYEEYLSRKEASKQRRRRIQTPILMIVNSFTYLDEIDSDTGNNDMFTSSVDSQLNDLTNLGNFGSSSSDVSLVDKVKTIYANGYLYNIFVVIQERRASSFNKYDRFVNMSKVICCDVNEIENCQINENGGTISISELPANYAILFPNVSKLRPYIFDKSKNEKEYINKLVEVLTNE